MTQLLMLTASCASIACLMLVIADIYYEDPSEEASNAYNHAVGILISVGSLTLPIALIKFIID